MISIFMDKTSEIIIISLVVFCLVWVGLVSQAGSAENVSGFAWSETIGWISFNSSNCDSDNNGTTDTGNFAQCPTGLSVSSYGVNIDTGNGNLSGQAWSDTVGWISFDESDLSGCPQSPCKAKVSSPGQIGKSDVDIEGWARACAGSVNGDCTGGDRTDGWDGWIRLDHGQSSEVYMDTAGDWHGWAWGDNVVGWISFNGADGGAGGDYKVVLGQHPPTASDLTVVQGDYCTLPAHYFSWTYSDPDGDDQSQFQFQVDNNTDFSSPEIDRTVVSVIPSGDSDNQTVLVATSPGSDQIGYNTTYYWRVKVWDSDNVDSGWITDSSFTTESHEYPSVDFSWSPSTPSQDEDVLFADQSTVYGGATKSAWAWTFTDGNPASSNEQNPTIQFTSQGAKQVTLEVTDSDSFVCTDSKSVGVQVELPGWRELLPW